MRITGRESKPVRFPSGETECCVEAFRQAVATAGCAPEIMNTDQGSQFTSDAWIKELKQHEGLKISMDGKGRWVDNVFIERKRPANSTPEIHAAYCLGSKCSG